MNAIIYHHNLAVCLVTNADHEQIMAQLRLERLKAADQGMPVDGWHFSTESWKASPRLKVVDFSQHPVYSHTEPHNL